MNCSRLIIFVIASIIIQMVQSTDDDMTKQYRQLQRKQVEIIQDGNVNPYDSVSVPLRTLDSLSGELSVSLAAILNAVSSPVQLCGQALQTTQLQSIPIFGPLSGTVVAGVEALSNSPITIHQSLSGGLEKIIDGIDGLLTSPFTLCDHISLTDPLDFVLYVPILFTFSNSLATVATGILEAAASPLTIAAQPLDQGVNLVLNSLGGNLIPEWVRLLLPGSYSRGVAAFIESPTDFIRDLPAAYVKDPFGFMGFLSSPLVVSSQVLTRQITLKNQDEYPTVFPGDSNDPISSTLGGALESFFKSFHDLADNSGVLFTGIVSVLLAPFSLSGRIIDKTFNTNIASPHVFPSQSNIGQPDSLIDTVQAVQESPLTLSATLSYGIHLLHNGVVGFLTSPLTVLAGDSPVPIPGSARNGLAGLPQSPQQLANVATTNVGFTLASIVGLGLSPFTLSSEVLRNGLNINPHSLLALPIQLERIGIPESIGAGIAGILEIPVSIISTIIDTFSNEFRITIENSGVDHVPGYPNNPPRIPFNIKI